MKITIKTRLLLVFLGIGLLWGSFKTKALAQWETLTPTLSPTPIVFITGTPDISTVWLKVDSNQIVKMRHSQQTENTSAIISLPTPEDLSPQPSPTPSIVWNNGASPSLMNENSTSTALSSSSRVSTQSSGTPTRLVKMMDFYQSGIRDYKDRHFDLAVRDLKIAVSMNDPSVPNYYYAEANTMLGVIYKFDLPNPRLARQYCEKALKIDPSTVTAQKLIREIGTSITQVERDYWAGIKEYEEGNNTQAIKDFSLAVHQNDPSTPSFYYAECYKTLGVIYQFHLMDSQKAYRYYQSALKIEPMDRTALRNSSKLFKPHS